MSSTSQDVLNLALDALRREKFGQKAIQIVNILSYFSAENVPTDIFNAEMSQDEVETATSLLKQYLLVDSAYKQDFININKLVQRKIRGCLREKKKEVPVLNEAVKLLIKKGKNPEEFQLLVDHAISVWLHACNIGNLVQKLEALPRLILPSLEKEFRYNEAAEFGWNALNRLKVSGKDNREIVWLQFHLGKLLDIMGKYKAALTILRPLLDRNIMELKLKNEIMHTVISVVKKLQDALQYDEILPVYEKILSDQKIGDTDKEEILCAWHHYALLLIKLDRCDDAVAILNDILKQSKIPLKNETIFFFKSSIADAFAKQAKYIKALNMYKELLEEIKLKSKKNHVEILKTKQNIAVNLQKVGKYNEIVMMFKEVIEKCENVIGKTHPETLSIQAELALVYFTQNEFKKAAEIFKTIHTNHGEMKMQKHKEVLDELTYEENLQFFESTLKELNDTFGLIAIKKRIESFNSVDIHIIHSAIREDDLGKIYTIIQNGIDINCKDSSGNTLLHYAALHGNLDVMKLLLEFGAIYNATNANNKTPLQLAENNSVKMLLNLTEKLFKHVKARNFVEVTKSIKLERCIVNAKDHEGYYPLHWSASNGSISILKLLLDAGADATYITNKGNTPLHIAVSKGFCGIADILLKSVRYDKLENFINAQTFGNKATSLHVAAKNNFQDIAHILLQYGAVFNIKNKDGKTPLELSEYKSTEYMLKLTHELFMDAENGNTAIIDKLKTITPGVRKCVSNACNEEGYTLIQVMLKNNHKKLSFQCLQLLKTPFKLKPWKNFRDMMQQLKNLEYFAKQHLYISQDFIPNLHPLITCSLFPPGINPIPSKTFKMGCDYLCSAYKLVEEYQKYYPNSIEDLNIYQINETLKELQFEPKLIPADYNEAAYFTSSQNTKFINLLGGFFLTNLYFFKELVEINIDIPVTKFLQTVTTQLRSIYSGIVFKAIENNNLPNIEKYIIEDRAILNLKVKGSTPLLYAVECGNLKIIKTLLENEADTTEKTCEGETLLHLATSKGYKEAAELLIKYTSHDKLSKLINATTKNGDTPLHIAARHGFTAISKSLLKYGATYCLKNKERKVPLDLAIKHINVKHLLQITHCCFEYAASNSSELNHILQSMKPDERLAVTNATNESGQTLLALIKSKHYQIISNELLETMNKYSRITLCRPLKTPEIRRRIYKAINAFLEYSEILLKQLALMSYCASEKNMSPRSTLKEGLLYLINAYRFVEEYKSCFGVVNNYQFQKIEETLKDLQFCPDDIRFGYTDEAYDEKMKSFIIDNKEAVYYKLLHSELTKDIRQFFYIVEKGIQVQVVDIFDNIEGFSFRVEFI